MKSAVALQLDLISPDLVVAEGKTGSGIQKLKKFWLKIRGLWIWGVLAQLSRDVFNLLFVVPAEQEHIERTKIKAMQYRGIL